MASRSSAFLGIPVDSSVANGKFWNSVWIFFRFRWTWPPLQRHSTFHFRHPKGILPNSFGKIYIYSSKLSESICSPKACLQMLYNVESTWYNIGRYDWNITLEPPKSLSVKKLWSSAESSSSSVRTAHEVPLHSTECSTFLWPNCLTSLSNQFVWPNCAEHNRAGPLCKQSADWIITKPNSPHLNTLHSTNSRRVHQLFLCSCELLEAFVSLTAPSWWAFHCHLNLLWQELFTDRFLRQFLSCDRKFSAKFFWWQILFTIFVVRKSCW